jgi:hypothetical protein
MSSSIDTVFRKPADGEIGCGAEAWEGAFRGVHRFSRRKNQSGSDERRRDRRHDLSGHISPTVRFVTSKGTKPPLQTLQNLPSIVLVFLRGDDSFIAHLADTVEPFLEGRLMKCSRLADSLIR